MMMLPPHRQIPGMVTEITPEFAVLISVNAILHFDLQLPG
jgi:hypothetical protein